MPAQTRELPSHIQEQIARMPEYSYGVNRVVVTLDDGTIVTDVYVGWATDILKVGEDSELRFDPRRVVAVRHQP